MIGANYSLKRNKKNKLKSYYFGLLSEYLVILLLSLKGYQILKRRYRNKLGEIDIIVRKKNLIIFIEVKARKKINSIDGTLSARQKFRIKNASLLFISQNKNYQNMNIRFDLVIFRNLLNIKYLKNFWS